MNNYLVAILGPTAAGKTAIAIDIALKYQTGIISADSRQIYKQLNIGTAKPTEAQLALVKHYFIDYLDITQEFSAGDFEREVLKVIRGIHKSHPIVIMCGGSGLYIDAVCRGIDEIPNAKKGMRENLVHLYEEEGLSFLLEELKVTDPEYFEKVDRKNPQRIIRALEVIRSTGEKFSGFRTRRKQKRDFTLVKIGLKVDRETLYRKIDQRVDQMIDDGLFDEVESLIPYAHLNALQTVGYKELFGYFNKVYDRNEAIRLLKRNTRRYAKRQMTWFKKDASIRWFDYTDKAGIFTYLSKVLNNR